MARSQQETSTIWWRTPFNALLTVPASIAVVIGSTAVAVDFAERVFGTPKWLEHLSVDAVFAILSVVATAAMTALTLAYSLTLVVFTLAASSIGPRLLKRFTTEKVNQITAGILGGTFLYALVALGLTGDTLPRVAAFGAGLLALVSVVQLIWFVRSVAQSVSVDDELAFIAARLERDLQRLRDNRQRGVVLPDTDSFHDEARTSQAGYLEQFDREALLGIATAADVVLQIEHMPGSYLLKDTVVIRASGELNDEVHEKLVAAVRQEPARSDAGTVHFSMNLLVEIALRALSPGVNDTFTAIAACDMLSGAIAGIANTDPEPEVIVDDDSNPRVILPGASVRQLIDEGFNPLRRAGSTNILMAVALARAYERLFAVGGREARDTLREHARLLVVDLRRQELDEADVATVVENMTSLAAEIDTTSRSTSKPSRAE